MFADVKKLGAIAFVLFIASFSLFYFDTKRGTEVSSGSDFIVGFDSEKVYEFSIDKKGEKVELTRRGDNFILKSRQGYPTANDRVNDFIYNMASIQIGEKVTDNVKRFKELKVDPTDFEYKVTFMDEKEHKLVDFYVGALKDNKNYVRHANKNDVYLTKSAVLMATNYSDFIKKNILKIDKKEIAKVNVHNKSTYALEHNEDKFMVTQPKKFEPEKSKVSRFISRISSLNFKDYKPANDSEVEKIQFNNKIEVSLANAIKYVMEFSDEKGKYYLKVLSSVKDAQKEIVISTQDDKEKLKGVEDTIMAQKKAQQFNLKHGAWIYEIHKSTFEDLNTGLADLKTK